MNKKVTVQQAKEAVRITRDSGLMCGTTFMFGYPGETKESIRETVEFCKELLLSPHIFFTTPYPGTPLYKEVRDRVLQKYGDEERFIENLGDVLDFTVNLTSFTDEELVNLKTEAEKELRSHFKRRYPTHIYHRYKELGIRNIAERLINKMIHRLRLDKKTSRPRTQIETNNSSGPS